MMTLHHPYPKYGLCRFKQWNYQNSTEKNPLQIIVSILSPFFTIGMGGVFGWWDIWGYIHLYTPSNITTRTYHGISLHWRHNGTIASQITSLTIVYSTVLLNRLFRRRRSKKASKLRVTGLCAGNSPGTGEFPAQMASYAENVSIWWRHHDTVQQ